MLQETIRELTDELLRNAVLVEGLVHDGNRIRKRCELLETVLTLPDEVLNRLLSEVYHHA